MRVFKAESLGQNRKHSKPAHTSIFKTLPYKLYVNTKQIKSTSLFGQNRYVVKV